jgi:hypothetical protein
MKPQTPDAGGNTLNNFSRHQVRSAATGSALRPRGNSRLRLGLPAARRPDTGVASEKFQAARRRQSKVPIALSAEAGRSQRCRPPMRQAIKQWCVAHAHAAWKTLAVACAAIS